MTKQDVLEVIQFENNLELIETTNGVNGYPSNLKKALIGFKTFEQCEKIANQIANVRIMIFHRRDGWQLWERQSTADEPFYNSSEDYGDEYYSFTSEEGDTYFENEVKPFLQDFENFEILNEFLKEREKVLNEILLLGDNEIVITYQGRYYETIEKESMSFYHDTHQYAIGIVID